MHFEDTPRPSGMEHPAGGIRTEWHKDAQFSQPCTTVELPVDGRNEPREYCAVLGPDGLHCCDTSDLERLKPPAKEDFFASVPQV